MCNNANTSSSIANVDLVIYPAESDIDMMLPFTSIAINLTSMGKRLYHSAHICRHIFHQ